MQNYFVTIALNYIKEINVDEYLKTQNWLQKKKKKPETIYEWAYNNKGSY